MVTESTIHTDASNSNRTDESTSHLRTRFKDLLESLEQKVIGQSHLCQQLLVAVLSDGHLLVEGAPGLAKTRAIKSLSEFIEGEFHRIQFTPDLLPSDLTGTDIYQPELASFSFQKGPLFHNLVLADEINRAPAKVQSALLESMAERQITIGKTTHPLPDLFLVMATQNPIEQEGTYPLPEAQLDRFLLQVNIDYPDSAVESQIVELAFKESLDNLTGNNSSQSATLRNNLSQSEIDQARIEVLEMFISPAVKEYIVQLVIATRNPSAYGDEFASWIEYGASPRGTIGLERASRANAWLSGKDYVSPDDVQKMAHDILRHRIILSFSAEAAGLTTDDVISKLISLVPVP